MLLGYKVEIKKINGSKFITSYYLFDEMRGKVFLSSIEYDENYKIFKIVKGGTIDYVAR